MSAEQPTESPEKVPPAEENEALEESPAKQEEVEEVKEMDIDEFYPDDHVEKPPIDSALSKRSLKFLDCFGQPSYKRYNFHWLGDNDFIYATGSTYQIFNVITKERRIFHGTDLDGIGSICVHPSKKYFAVAEKGVSPNVYIYEWPSLRLYRVCRKGTELAYAHVEFSTSGKLLASLGSAPDYTLTVWDWLKQKVILKAKAFSQEIFRVSFSPYTDDILFTAGSGHIRFWKMAQTFTGLKLQGEIAKFGQLELSDQSAFYELPDGKVVSGTEYGTLIVWEGQFVKAHLMSNTETKTPLHKGMIEVLLQDEDCYVTAGADGFIKWFNIQEIDSAEADEGVDFEIQPVKEVFISETHDDKNPAHIINMTRANNKWYIQDAKGYMFVMDYGQTEYQQVYSFNDGAIKAIAASPSHNYALTLGQNGTVRVWDYVRKQVVHSEQFSGKGVCFEHMPHTEANKGRVVAAGYDNGVVRILGVTADGIELLKAFKAHDDSITAMKYSQDLRMFVTASSKGDIFFFEIDGKSDLQRYEPLCTVHIEGEPKINALAWNEDDKSVLLACDTGYVYEIRRPEAKEIDNSDSYLWEKPDMKTWRIKIMEFQMAKNQKKDEAEEEKKRRMRLRGELPPEEDEPEEDWDPECLHSIVPFADEEGNKRFIVSSQGQFNGFIYICSIDSIRPLKAIPIPKGLTVSFMKEFKKASNTILVIAYDDGSLELVVNQNFDCRMKLKHHDSYFGPVQSLALSGNDDFLMTVGSDGLFNLFQFDRQCCFQDSKFDPLKGVEGASFMPNDEKEALIVKKTREYFENSPAIFPDISEAEMGLDEASLAITFKLKQPTGEDVTDPTIYSIQQSKLRTEEDHRLTLAEKKKEGVRKQIEELRQEFKKALEKNLANQEHLRIGEDDLQVDPEFFQILQDRNEAKIEEAKREVAWGIEYHTINLNKLKNKFYDVLEFEKYQVKAIKEGAHVTTFRVQKMSEFLQSNIEAFKQMLENEIAAKDSLDEADLPNEESKETGQVDNERQKEKDKQAAILAKQKAAQQAALDAKKSEAEKKREARKLEREERKRQIEKLEKKEAMHSGEDPEDRREIEIAEQTFGDHKLKTSPDYTVPENQRVNFSKKRQQMVLLEGSIHKLKVDFNQKVQELKLRKKDICEHVQEVNKRLAEINEELGEKDSLIEPKIDETTEYPEKYFEITEKDLQEFQLKKEAEQAKNAKKGKAAPKAQEELAIPQHQQEEEQPFDIETAKALTRRGAKKQMTDIDDEFAQIRRIELEYEKQQKMKEINDVIETFDKEITEMQREKYRLESDLKNAEMKLILFFEELILLKSMEGRDIQLTKRLGQCRQEKGHILKEINEISRKLKDKKKEIDEIKDKEEDLMTKFHELCPERSDKYDEIRKFFEKIIKRKRRVERAEKEEEDEEDEEEEDPEEDEDEDEDENTIAGLNPEEYKIEEIEKLREDRLDLYEEKEKILAFINDLEVQRKRLENKERVIKSDLEETEEEIQDFQAEKMSKLNELQISVVLKVKQIQNMLPDQSAVDRYGALREEQINKRLEALQARIQETGEDPAIIDQEREQLLNEEDWRGYYLPKDLKDSILFTRTQLLQLINRERELQEERFSLEKAFREYKRDFNQKKKEIKENEKVREVREREYNERQMLRFGSLVDMDNLEVGGPSPVVLELQNKFVKTEKRCIRMIEEADGEMEQTQRELTQQMRNNTNLLNLIRTLGEEELDLDKKLNDSNKAIFVDEDDDTKQAALEEKLKIKKLLEIQAKEIETFKTEINMYKRKGGHIYTKVTTNRRAANLNQEN